MRLAALLLACLVPLAASAADGDQACLGCHGQPGLTKTFGKDDTLQLHVDPKGFAASVHAPLGCIACHAGIDLKSHPGASKAFGSAREFSAAAGEACQTCHEPIAKAHAGSVHAKALLCADCHRVHEVIAGAATRSNDACTTCHASARDAHAKWLPNTNLHLEVVACGACHSAAAQRRIDLRLHDNEKKAELVGTDPLLPAGNGPIDEERLASLLQAAGGKATLAGRVEVTDGAAAHALGAKSAALKDCTTCHRKGAETFQKVSVSLLDVDGRRVRHDAQKDLLHSPTSVDHMRGFYAVGGTRITLLDIALGLALVGGILAPLGHLVMRRLSRRRKD